MVRKVKEERKECPYAVMVFGVPICGLNVCPCERVDDKLCERIYTTLMPEGGSGVAGKEHNDGHI